MAVHPDLTAFRAVDACGGTYTPAEEACGYAAGHRAALDAAAEAVKAADALTADLLAMLERVNGLLNSAMRETNWCDGEEAEAEARALIAKAEGRS